MLKNTGVYVLIFLICLPFLGKLGVFLDFKINQTEIAQFLCIQKEIPKNACQGKCQLSKRFKNVEEQEEKQNTTEKKEKTFTLFYLPVSDFLFLSQKKIKPLLKIFYSNLSLYTFEFSISIFHPPSLL